MALQHTMLPLFSTAKENAVRLHASSGINPRCGGKASCSGNSFLRMECLSISSKLPNGSRFISSKVGASKSFERLKSDKLREKERGETSDEEEYSHSDIEDVDNDDDVMDEEERREWRMKIREVINKIPDIDEEVDPIEKRKKMQKLMEEYPLVVEEDDPDWPEDADGWGFNFDQFFNKITIKNVKTEKDDDENDDSDNEIVWQDDDYIRPIKDITSAEWEVTVFKDISPLIVLVHNRYKRPRQNEKLRDELEKSVQIIWNCNLPSPRCVAVDAVVEHDLVSALQVSGFPELIFTKAGKILYREKAMRTADELSKIMAFFYYGAAKPPFLSSSEEGQEAIPSVPRSTAF